MVWYSERDPRWKPLPMRDKVNGQCPRCGNTVDFQLGYYDEGVFLAGIKLFGPRKAVLHCPICIYFSELDEQDLHKLRA